MGEGEKAGVQEGPVLLQGLGEILIPLRPQFFHGPRVWLSQAYQPECRRPVDRCLYPSDSDAPLLAVPVCVRLVQRLPLCPQVCSDLKDKDMIFLGGLFQEPRLCWAADGVWRRQVQG